MTTGAPNDKLEKNLKLLDVYAISTGAMFSSGFFLLPGLAAAMSGPSVVLAYGLAAILIMPAMLSVAELSTAMPRAGGAYYFLDRAMGPLVGTVGGLGTWLALVLKSAFALIGMGAYLAIYFEMAIEPLAIALTVVFMLINVFGAKETSRLQRILVYVVVGILAFFIAEGVMAVFGRPPTVIGEQFTPFMPFGFEGVLASVGFVFVSYAGLTKVASVAEEVENPDRNIPLGMLLSLFTATFIYVVGVAVMVAVLEPNEFRSDLTPVATAAQQFMGWLPEGVGVMLVVIAAIAAFASTGNAGIMSASRYPLAMARDRLISPKMAVLGRFGTPLAAIVVTAAAIVFFILAFDVAAVAKLASAFQLLLFGLLNVAVIVMRQSGIEWYHPGFESPLYPWVQLAGILIPVVLIIEMGVLPMVFTAGVIVAAVAWYYWYARPKVVRHGAIYHVFERLGRLRYPGLDEELRGIMSDKGVREEDLFDAIVADSTLSDIEGTASFEAVIERACRELARRTGLDPKDLEQKFLDEHRVGLMPLADGVAMPHLRLADIDRPYMHLIRVADGVDAPFYDAPIHAFIVLVSPLGRSGQHLRVLAQVSSRVEEPDFLDEWLAVDSQQDLIEALVGEERVLSIKLKPGLPCAELVGRQIGRLTPPRGVLIALIRRGGEVFVPGLRTVLREDDRLVIMGDPESLSDLRRRPGRLCELT